MAGCYHLILRRSRFSRIKCEKPIIYSSSNAFLIQGIFTIHFAYKAYHLVRNLTPHICSSFSGVPKMYPLISYSPYPPIHEMKHHETQQPYKTKYVNYRRTLRHQLDYLQSTFSSPK